MTRPRTQPLLSDLAVVAGSIEESLLSGFGSLVGGLNFFPRFVIDPEGARYRAVMRNANVNPLLHQCYPES